MIKSRKVPTKKILNIVLIVVISFCIFQGVQNITYANANLNKPDVTVTVDKYGQTVSEGDLLGKDLWYPGRKVSGVIRVYNNYKPFVLKDLNVNVTMESPGSGIDRASVYRSFLENMKLTIKKGKFLVFNETLFEDRSFLQLMNVDKDPTGADQSVKRGFRLAGGDFIDLNYCLKMDEKSGDELENLTASVEVQLSLGDDIVAE